MARPVTEVVRAPEQVLDDPHLLDRGFWKEIEHPLRYPSAGIRSESSAVLIE
jgi:crotonobetainyl-CoA:carnitine CoA-transferase CaiB-like acyl-CoA transferase